MASPRSVGGSESPPATATPATTRAATATAPPRRAAPRPVDGRARASARTIVPSAPVPARAAAVGRRSGRGANMDWSNFRRDAGSDFGTLSILPVAARTMSSPGSPCPYGPSPVAANSSVAPSENTSVAGVTGSPRACSGAMKPGVPTTIPAIVRPWVWSRLRATPKSARHGSPRSSNRMLAGLMSRWITPARWAEASAPSSRRAWRSTSSAGAGPCWATRSARLPPER